MNFSYALLFAVIPSRSSGEQTRQNLDQIYINTCAVNIQENQNPQSDFIDMSTVGNHHYQALDVTMRENAPYEICHSSQKVNSARLHESP